jgi:hypothetical protein
MMIRNDPASFGQGATSILGVLGIIRNVFPVDVWRFDGGVIFCRRPVHSRLKRCGMTLMELQMERQSNPVDMIEFVASNNDWSFERSCEDEIAMTVNGRWAAYHVSFSWMEDCESLHLACAFDLRVPEPKVNEIIRLLSRINGQVMMGHFDLWKQEDVVIFRQSLLLAGGAEPTNQQVEVLLSSAVEACEAYYEAFQYVIWSGLDAKAAMDVVLFTTVGEA